MLPRAQSIFSPTVPLETYTKASSLYLLISLVFSSMVASSLLVPPNSPFLAMMLPYN